MELLCACCGRPFTPTSRTHNLCSDKCRDEIRQRNTLAKTNKEYKRLTNNWNKYFSKAISRIKHRHKDSGCEVDLTTDDLIQILALQEYRCALSGMPLSCRLDSGVTHHTNASIDRIDAGGPYNTENIQLVCSALNSFRNAVTLEEFIGWCIAVAEKHAEEY